MIINISEPNGPYAANIDPGVMEVRIFDAFLGVQFVTKEGEKLSVSMKDGGFEVKYSGDFGHSGFNYGWIDFKSGFVRRRVTP